jgi:hypothetical protein
MAKKGWPTMIDPLSTPDPACLVSDPGPEATRPGRRVLVHRDRHRPGKGQHRPHPAGPRSARRARLAFKDCTEARQSGVDLARSWRNILAGIDRLRRSREMSVRPGNGEYLLTNRRM